MNSEQKEFLDFLLFLAVNGYSFEAYAVNTTYENYNVNVFVNNESLSRIKRLIQEYKKLEVVVTKCSKTLKRIYSRKDSYFAVTFRKNTPRNTLRSEL